MDWLSPRKARKTRKSKVVCLCVRVRACLQRACECQGFLLIDLFTLGFFCIMMEINLGNVAIVSIKYVFCMHRVAHQH